jgi:hypothetical protein
VAYYRLLFLDLDNAIVNSCDFHSRNHSEAIHIAEGKRGLSAMELWDGARKIKRWDCFPPDELL